MYTQTFENSNQAVHPDILVFKNGYTGKLSKSYKYVMVYTPYPDSVNSYEHPCITVAETPNGSFVNDNIINPIHPTSSFSDEVKDYRLRYQADPDILHINRVFYLYWITRGGILWELYRQTSVDLTNWTDAEQCQVSGLLTTFDGQLSPTVIFDGVWKMWTVDKDTHATTCCVSSDGIHWNAKTKTNIPGNFRGAYAWHIDIQKLKKSNQYWAVILYTHSSEGGPPGDLYFSVSSDGENWKMFNTTLLSNSEDGWDDNLYRATFAVYQSRFMLWYSAFFGLQFHIGYSEKQISDVVAEGEESGNVV
jgi:predicted GH43/DUF377 family glycosyl hydrolase